MKATLKRLLKSDFRYLLPILLVVTLLGIWPRSEPHPFRGTMEIVRHDTYFVMEKWIRLVLIFIVLVYLVDAVRLVGYLIRREKAPIFMIVSWLLPGALLLIIVTIPDPEIFWLIIGVPPFAPESVNGWTVYPPLSVYPYLVPSSLILTAIRGILAAGMVLAGYLLLRRLIGRIRNRKAN